jgi:hypothetical protein
VSDAAKASALIEAAWKAIEPTERATKGEVKHPGPAALDRAGRPGVLAEHVRIAGSSLVVTTHPALLDPAADAKPRATWMASAEHPALKQLAGHRGSERDRRFRRASRGAGEPARTAWGEPAQRTRSATPPISG